MVLKVFLWSSFFAIVAYFTHKQLSTEVITFEGSIFIPGPNKNDVYEFVKNVEVSMKYNFNTHSVTDIVHIFGDGGEPDKIKFTRQEKVSIQGLYDQVVETPCIASLYPSLPKIQLDVNILEGLIIGSVNIVFQDGTADGQAGTLLTERFEVITPYFFAKLVNEETKSTHRRFLNHVKKHFENSVD